MKCLLAMLVLVIAASSASAAPRFIALDVYLDTAEALAAWQFELRDLNRGMTVVGIENGESDAFEGAPYYDRDAVNTGAANRIIVADFSLADLTELPRGKIHIATIHVLVDGTEPNFDIELITATTREGQRIDAPISLIEQSGS